MTRHAVAKIDPETGLIDIKYVENALDPSQANYMKPAQKLQEVKFDNLGETFSEGINVPDDMRYVEPDKAIVKTPDGKQVRLIDFLIPAIMGSNPHLTSPNQIRFHGFVMPIGA